MIFTSTIPSFYFYGGNPSPFYVYPQLFMAPPIENLGFEVTGNIKKQETSTISICQAPAEKQERPIIRKKQPTIDSKKYNLNIKNVIPNLVRKLFGFLTSEHCRDLIQKIDPELSKIEISKILSFVQAIKNSLGTYVGKRNLRKLWFKDRKTNKSSKVHEVLRRVSRYYFEKECANSIILSKRIKPSLKPTHLKYRRKLIKMLNKCTEQQI